MPKLQLTISKTYNLSEEEIAILEKVQSLFSPSTKSEPDFLPYYIPPDRQMEINLRDIRLKETLKLYNELLERIYDTRIS